jgi:hypothetical protein
MQTQTQPLSEKDEPLIGGIPARLFIGRQVRLRGTDGSPHMGRGKLVAIMRDRAVVRPHKHGKNEIVELDEIHPFWSQNSDLRLLVTEEEDLPAPMTPQTEPEALETPEPQPAEALETPEPQPAEAHETPEPQPAEAHETHEPVTMAKTPEEDDTDCTVRSLLDIASYLECLRECDMMLKKLAEETCEWTERRETTLLKLREQQGKTLPKLAALTAMELPLDPKGSSQSLPNSRRRATRTTSIDFPGMLERLPEGKKVSMLDKIEEVTGRRAWGTGKFIRKLKEHCPAHLKLELDPFHRQPKWFAVYKRAR